MLASLQRQLERIYEVEIPHRVDDFLVTDPGVLNDIHGHEGPGQSEIEEQLLVVQDGDCLDIALYVDSDVVNRLTQDDLIAVEPGADLCRRSQHGTKQQESEK